MLCIFRSTLQQSRPNKAGLKCPSIRPYMCTLRTFYVREYVRSFTKRFFDSSEIWHVGRGQWVMHDGMQYDSIQGQGHEPFKVGNPAVFKAIFYAIYNDIWQLTTDS